MTSSINDEDRTATIQEFCLLERMSIATYNKIKNSGHGPDELRLPGTNVIRITSAARRAWHERMAAWRESKEGVRERERRSALARHAAASAVMSPDHVSNKRRKSVQASKTGAA